MNLFHAAILGIIQGLTEFIPVSSSAHLVIVPWLLGWPDPGIAFDVALHVGTLIALIVYFWSDWFKLARGAWNAIRHGSVTDSESHLGLGIILGTIPAGIAGLLGEKKIDALFHSDDPHIRARAMVAIALALGGVGLLLLIAEKVVEHRRSLERATLVDAIMIGFAQMLALIPGVSRSGATITAGLALGFTRHSAAHFSFLLAAPIMIGAGLKKSVDVFRGKVLIDDIGAFVVGLVVSAVVGFFCIRFLLAFLQERSTVVFVWYRLALAAVLIVIVLRMP